MDELNSLEPEFEYDLPEPVETEQEKEIRRVQKTLYCFHCNRKESHVPIKSYNRLSSFILGMTFGLTRLIGPFYCRCCGNSRLFWADWVNPRYHWIQWQYHRVAKRRRRRR